MSITTRNVNFIGGHEGFVSTWYLDPVHVPTIGYGFTWSSAVFRDWWMQKHGRKMQKGDTISQTDAHQVLLGMIAHEYAPPVDDKFAGFIGHLRHLNRGLRHRAGRPPAR